MARPRKTPADPKTPGANPPPDHDEHGPSETKRGRRARKPRTATPREAADAAAKETPPAAPGAGRAATRGRPHATRKGANQRAELGGGDRPPGTPQEPPTSCAGGVLDTEAPTPAASPASLTASTLEDRLARARRASVDLRADGVSTAPTPATPAASPTAPRWASIGWPPGGRVAVTPASSPTAPPPPPGDPTLAGVGDRRPKAHPPVASQRRQA